MAELNLSNPATSGAVPQMPLYGGPMNNPAFVHTSTDRRPQAPGKRHHFNAMTPQFSKDPLKMANLNKAFLTGFCEKCAAYKISPFKLLEKQAIGMHVDPGTAMMAAQMIESEDTRRLANMNPVDRKEYQDAKWNQTKNRWLYGLLGGGIGAGLGVLGGSYADPTFGGKLAPDIQKEMPFLKDHIGAVLGGLTGGMLGLGGGGIYGHYGPGAVPEKLKEKYLYSYKG